MNDYETITAAMMKSKEALTRDTVEVVKSLDETVWGEIDVERKVREKLQEFAAELQMIKAFRDTD